MLAPLELTTPLIMPISIARRTTIRIAGPISIFLRVGGSGKYIEFLIHVPHADLHDNSYPDAPAAVRPTFYQKLLKFRSIFVQLFEVCSSCLSVQVGILREATQYLYGAC